MLDRVSERATCVGAKYNIPVEVEEEHEEMESKLDKRFLQSRQTRIVNCLVAYLLVHV
jgi:hypothetical protein